MKHQSVSSEHVLLALVVEQNGIAGKNVEMDLNETEISTKNLNILIGYGGIRSYPKRSLSSIFTKNETSFCFS